MEVRNSEMISQGEVESPLQSERHLKNQAMQQLGRQSSIYSLTLDEFQHTLCEGGKNFGSMNMDEFLNSIWTAEENQAQVLAAHHSNTAAPGAAAAANSQNNQFPLVETSIQKPIVSQPSLPRQGSLQLPAPLCRKTVEEVWSEIQKSHHEQQQSNNTNVQNSGSTERQRTFGEMTLEDFLVRAGVVREQVNQPLPPQQPPPPPYGLFQGGNNPSMGPNLAPRPIMSMGGAGGVGVGVPTYPPLPHGGIGETPGYAGNGKRGGGYPAQPLAMCYGGRPSSGGGGYAQMQGLGMGSPVSPVSSDGMQMDNQYGLDMGGMRGGRKRIIDGPVEKVVEAATEDDQEQRVRRQVQSQKTGFYNSPSSPCD